MSLLAGTARLWHGQFYTPSLLCDWMLALAALACETPAPWRILEPGCGAGAFLSRAAVYAADANLAFELHGVELHAATAEKTRRNLQDTAAIHTADFISPDMDMLGTFDLMIGNPPYVRHEHIVQAGSERKDQALDYLREKYKDDLQACPEQKKLFGKSSDLYIWFFLQAATLLKPGGSLAFVVSNSWLSASFSKVFQRFLNRHFHIRAVIESDCERWFPDAAVNAVILVLQKKPSAQQADHALTALTRLRIPLQDCSPLPEETDYWEQLQMKARMLLDAESGSFKDDRMSVCRVSQAELCRDEAMMSWRLHLKSSAPVFGLLKQSSLWQPLSTLGKVRYPIKTGINRFFYLDETRATAWKIEPEFLFPVAKSARAIRHYRVQSSQLNTFLFSCDQAPDVLESAGKFGAAAYIRWGETQSAAARQKRTNAIPWPQVASVQNNRPWHFIRPISAPHFLCNRFIDQRFFFALCEGDMMEDQTFYGLTLHQTDRMHRLFIGGLLNSTFSYLLLELLARANLGEGVLQFARCDMDDFPVMNPAIYAALEKRAVAYAFEAMLDSPVQPVNQLSESPERNMLDYAVLVPLLKAAGFSGNVESVRSHILDELIDLVQRRHMRARSVSR